MDYIKVVEELKKSFAPGTVKHRSDNNRAYIPNQVYTDRVEKATNSCWDREIIEIDINVPHRYIKVITRVTIGPHSRDGYGLGVIKGEPEKNPSQIASALDYAVHEAIRDALDSWQMGWVDLAKYNSDDWGGNPSLRHFLNPNSEPGSGKPVQSLATIDRNCIQCGELLTEGEWSLLKKVPKLNREKMTYCYNHLPNHFKQKIPEAIRLNYEQGHK